MIHWSTLGWDEVIFSHIDPDTGAQTDYAISTMLAWIKANEHEVEKLRAAIQPEAAQMVEACRGIEQHRLIPLLSVPDPDPVIFVMQPDDTALLVDGSHRYVAMWKQGQPDLRAYVLTHEQAQHFIIDGIQVMPPDKVVGGYSGL